MHYDLSRVLRLNITVPTPTDTPTERIDAFKRECADRLRALLNIEADRLRFVIQPNVQQDISAYISQSRTDDLAKVLCAKVVYRLHAAYFGATRSLDQ